jgi:hypothetical protein
VTTLYTSLQHTDQSSLSCCSVTASNGGRSSASGLTSTGGHLTPTSVFANHWLRTIYGRKTDSFIKPRHGPHREHCFQFFYCRDHVTGVRNWLAMGVFAQPFPSNGRLSGSAISLFRRHVTIPMFWSNCFFYHRPWRWWQQVPLKHFIICNVASHHRQHQPSVTTLNISKLA